MAGWGCIAGAELGAGWIAAGPGCDLKIGSYPRHSLFDLMQLRQVGCASSHCSHTHDEISTGSRSQVRGPVATRGSTQTRKRWNSRFDGLNRRPSRQESNFTSSNASKASSAHGMQRHPGSRHWDSYLYSSLSTRQTAGLGPPLDVLLGPPAGHHPVVGGGQRISQRLVGIRGHIQMRWRWRQRLLWAGVILGHGRCERGPHRVLATGRLDVVLKLLERVMLGRRGWLRCLRWLLLRLLLLLLLLMVVLLDGRRAAVEVADGRQIERGQRHVGTGGRCTVRLGVLARA